MYKGVIPVACVYALAASTPQRDGQAHISTTRLAIGAIVHHARHGPR